MEAAVTFLLGQLLIVAAFFYILSLKVIPDFTPPLRNLMPRTAEVFFGIFQYASIESDYPSAPAVTSPHPPPPPTPPPPPPLSRPPVSPEERVLLLSVILFVFSPLLLFLFLLLPLSTSGGSSSFILILVFHSRSLLLSGG